MRRRWKVSEGFWWVLFNVWTLGWLPIFLGWNLIWPVPHNGTHLGSMIFMAVWFGVLGVPGACYLTWLGLRIVWRERPRRVWEPVTEDLREQDNPER